MNSEIIETLAQHLESRVESCKYFNPNLGEWAHLETRARLRGYRVAARIAISRVELEVKGFDTAVSLSVNQSDPICLLDHLLTPQPEGFACPVFLHSSLGQPATTWLGAPENAALISDLELASDEALQIYTNAIVLIGHPTRATLETLQGLCDLADRLRFTRAAGLVDGLPFSVKRLPADLRALAPLIRKFAVGDDSLRNDLLTEASPAERRRLRESVRPLLQRINEFLESFGTQPVSNEGMLVGYLAEAVDELGEREA